MTVAVCVKKGLETMLNRQTLQFQVQSLQWNINVIVVNGRRVYYCRCGSELGVMENEKIDVRRTKLMLQVT